MADRKPRAIRMKEAAARLGVHPETFRRNYKHLFTDLRPPDRRGRTTPILVPEDEVDQAIAGGYPALADYRHRMGRDRRAAG